MKRTLFLLLAWIICGSASAQEAWYIDGYHGGVWGHYPDWNTRFMADQLAAHPDWNINIEIEPETWARAIQVDSLAFNDFRKFFDAGRIEYVNPTYAQGYLYNISGESIVRQFQYGMQSLKKYFPNAEFTTYSSEEPCFTSALPQILTSFGFKYASLKNPNTCFGGYTRAHGGEKVYWIGPDGSAILTSPRYAIEALSNQSTWQTIAWNNGAGYLQSAHNDGIVHPIGMTLQDAGWKGGPFIGNNANYTTWRNYFEHVVNTDSATRWNVSQEDILVNLVWGSQVTQRIAQQVRAAENKILQTEKLLAMAVWEGKMQWPQAAFDTAWRTLLLAEHHDCWIVPYNGQPGDTWADKVCNWTTRTHHICDSLIDVAFARQDYAQITLIKNGYQLENDMYRINIDTVHGGVITELFAKKINRSFAVNGFNELRGNFYEKGGRHSSMESPVRVSLLPDGLQMKGLIAGTPFTQTITLTSGDPKIDFTLRLDWKENTKIGQPVKGEYKWEKREKPFYNDSNKLLVVFPSTLKNVHVAKDAPYDVTESQLDNTFFNSWDSIKNNIILNWVDITDGKCGMALFTDHTTSYTHGRNFPLGLDIQYSGMGLWGRNYTIDGPTTVHYAIVLHKGNWEQGNIPAENMQWNEPMISNNSIFTLDGGPVQVTSMSWKDGRLIVRLYNPSIKTSQARLSFSREIAGATLVELNGRTKANGKTKAIMNNKQVIVDLPRFAIRTLSINPQ
ncbi:glycoside hydrolase family 38 C-terminal domain-containing protein [Chitinophaga sancti]|uniref:glycoside hydrolase family 38 N-terminal domain-containing protein n=1 Tax=Chitinophaga sancti TaxID=1004 RepID=UPI002A75D09E|nr:glycoside hydrolase family 38 C-terminal domain-containing protein [Chitinophaga sancti]WPQ61720.1 glycoside hydrolase family 38 C-terminal domain-containing protein [Chitinophaga sancti]